MWPLTRRGLPRTTLRMSALVLGCCLIAGAGAGENGEHEQLEWSVTSRDVYVDGEMQPGITVLRTSEPPRLAFLTPGEPIARVVEADGDGHRLLAMPVTDLVFQSPLEAFSAAPEEPLDGSVTALPDGLWIVAEGRQILVLPHQGSAGAVDVDQLWREAPVWRQLYEAYEPDPQAVETLRRQDRPTTLTVAFGTWCGDSRRSVPRLLKAVSLAGNPNLDVELVAIRRGFTKPLDFARHNRVTNVPTVIARSGEQEIGRFVERPRSAAVETDLAAILDDRPVPPSERFNDSDRLLAAATLGLFSGDRRLGEERWRFYQTEDDGARLWIRRRDGSGLTETWQSFDDEHVSTFIEVTRSADDELSRTRLSRRGDTARSTTRGDATGIVDQTVDLPADAVLLAPGASGIAQAWRQAGRPADARRVPAHALAAVDGAAPGKVMPLHLARLPDQAVTTPGGPITATGLEVGFGERSGRYWLHPELDLPLLVELDDGHRLVLESITVEGH